MAVGYKVTGVGMAIWGIALTLGVYLDQMKIVFMGAGIAIASLGVALYVDEYPKQIQPKK